MVEEGGLRGCVVRSFLLGTWRHFGINLVCNGKAKSVILLVLYLVRSIFGDNSSGCGGDDPCDES